MGASFEKLVTMAVGFSEPLSSDPKKRELLTIVEVLGQKFCSEFWEEKLDKLYGIAKGKKLGSLIFVYDGVVADSFKNLVLYIYQIEFNRAVNISFHFLF